MKVYQQELRSLRYLNQPSRRANAIQKDILVIATSLPQCKTSHTLSQNSLALESKGLCIIIRHKNLPRRIIHRRHLGAVVPPGRDIRRRLTRSRQEPSLLNHAPELVRAARGLRVATVINWRVVVPAGPLKPVRRVLRREHIQRGRAIGERIRRRDAEPMAVRADAQHELRGRHAGRGPGGQAELERAHDVAGVAGRLERRVGAGGGRPRAVDVVVHDHEVVEDVGEAGEVGGLRAGGVVPREERGCGGEVVGGAGGGGAELLQEGEEVGGVVVGDGVAA